MAAEPKDVDKLQAALNDAAGKASVLWTTFITFELYLVIAFGSVTHRNLFLEDPIKLPLLNVDLPLVGFFLIAPALLVIFHFYVFLQLLALARKARDYDSVLREVAPEAADRQLLRQRVDSFLVLQFLAGPAEQRTGFSGLSLRIIAWITLVGAPVLILLQGQVTFLPYHGAGVTWLQRILILFDVVAIWYFWNSIRSNDTSIFRPIPSLVWQLVGVTASFIVVIFSICLATFPGEFANDGLPGQRIWNFLSGPLFAGPVDQVNGRPGSWFSNRLVLTDQSFIDPDNLDKVETSRSLRGRDLTAAVLSRADLRKADFTGAVMDYAWLDGTKLQGARLVSRLIGASLHRTQLQGASLNGAQLQGAWLDSAQLQGASLDGAQLQGASLFYTQLEGASLNFAQLQGARLDGTELQGASLDRAQLQGAWLFGASLQGASLEKTELAGALLINARVWRAQGRPRVNLMDAAELDLKSMPWDPSPTLNFADWRQFILEKIPQADRRNRVMISLSALDPTKKNETEFWNETLSAPLQHEGRNKQLADFLANLGCSRDGQVTLGRPDEPPPPEPPLPERPLGIPTVRDRVVQTAAKFAGLFFPSPSVAPSLPSPTVPPHVARGLIRYGRIWFAGAQVTAAVADKLQKGKSDPSACPGVDGFTEKDWKGLDALAAGAEAAR
jgi:uncharacterized protein YjbI with pentapeptide repeats